MLQWIGSLTFFELLAWCGGAFLLPWLLVVAPWPETEEGGRRLGSFIAGAAIVVSLIVLAI